jgi:hypothetical protein
MPQTLPLLSPDTTPRTYHPHTLVRSCWFYPALVLSLLVALPLSLGARAQESAVTVTVLDSAGTPVADIEVLVQKSNRVFSEPPKGNAALPDGAARPEPRLLQAVKTVAKSRTSEKGIVVFKNLPEGTYRISAGKPSLGRAGQTVTVEKDKSLDVKLQLAK